MAKYPNSACEQHRDVKTNEPACIICMAEENVALAAKNRMLAEEVEKLRPGGTAEKSSYREDDGCPAEGAVLKREWRKYRSALTQIINPRPSLECPEFYAESDNFQRIAREALAESV